MEVFHKISSSQLDRTLDIVSAIAVYGFAFFALLSTTLGAVFFWLCVALGLLVVLKRPPMGTRIFFVSWALVVLYILLRTVVAVLFNSSQATYHIDGAWGWIRLFLFPAIGVLCAGDTKRCQRMLWVGMLGLLLGMALSTSLTSLERAWEGMRFGFSHRVIAFGLYSGTVLFGLLCFAPRLWGIGRRKVIGIITWVLLVAIFGQALIFTQSRGSWLAFIATFLGVIFIVFRIRSSFNIIHIRYFRTAVFIGMAVLCILTVGSWSYVGRRLSQVKGAILVLSKSELGKPASTSDGYRAQLYLYALHSIKLNPLWGYGPAESYYFIRKSGLESLRVLNWKGQLQSWDHLHSTHLEVLFHFGLIGYALFAWLILVLYLMIWRAWKRGYLDRSFTLFAISSLTYMLFWALFDFRALHPDWRYYWNLLAGVLFGGSMTPSPNKSL